MSFFIGTLPSRQAYDIGIRIAVLLASVISAACGYLVLRSPRQGR